jgi:hypothetical protein
VQARRVEALAAEHAVAVGPHERRDDLLPDAEPAHRGAHLLDHPEELVPDALARLAFGHATIGPQVTAADARVRHPHDDVRRLLHMRLGYLVHPDVIRSVNHCGQHVISLVCYLWRMQRYICTTTPASPACPC